jgi:carboxyl-terminal processing protease
MELRSSLKKPGWIPGFLFFALCLALGLALSRQSPRAGIYAQICYFVGDHIYLPDKEITPWLQSCVKRSHLVTKQTSVQTILTDLNEQFSSLNTSHLVLYSSQESQKIWQGESAETGIESLYVEGELVIFRVHKDSPAESAGLRMGDVIYQINGEAGNPSDAENKSGDYLIIRDKKIKEYKIQAKDIKRDEDPELVPVSAKTVLYKIPSFRGEFFEKEKWQSQIQELKKYQKIIIDLRGNHGGNFVAGLRFLSAFMCSPQDIGYLWKPKSKSKKELVLPDDLDDEKQIEVLDQAFLVKLWTFEDYECLASSIAVLVDSNTASTAEMTAQALKDYVGAKIFGSASAGQLLVGVWYPVAELGPGVKISVPEAVYQTRRGHKIEGPGVQVDKVLYYHLSEMQNGEDSWIKSAVQLF